MSSTEVARWRESFYWQCGRAWRYFRGPPGPGRRYSIRRWCRALIEAMTRCTAVPDGENWRPRDGWGRIFR